MSATKNILIGRTALIAVTSGQERIGLIEDMDDSKIILITDQGTIAIFPRDKVTMLEIIQSEKTPDIPRTEEKLQKNNNPFSISQKQERQFIKTESNGVGSEGQVGSFIPNDMLIPSESYRDDDDHDFSVTW